MIRKKNENNSQQCLAHSISGTLSSKISDAMPRHLIDLLCLILPRHRSLFIQLNYLSELAMELGCLLRGLAATCLGKNPMVQRSVPSRTRAALITVSIRASQAQDLQATKIFVVGSHLTIRRRIARTTLSRRPAARVRYVRYPLGSHKRDKRHRPPGSCGVCW